MLNRMICLKCSRRVDSENEVAKDYKRTIESEIDACGEMVAAEYESHFSGQWRNGFVTCDWMWPFDGYSVKVKEDPPQWCRYKLEHIISNQRLT